MRLSFRKTRKTNSSAGPGCLLIFGGVFFVVGLFMGSLTVGSIYRSMAARSWVETPVTIIETDLETHYSDGSTTYQCTARYRYTFEGADYESTRVSFESGSDNLGRFHQNAHQTLKSHLDSGEPFMARVDPDNPSQAVLYPAIRWAILMMKAVFALVFGGAGATIMIFGLLSFRKSKRRKEREKEHPEEPWLLREDWAEGRVIDSSKSSMVLMIIFAVFWNLISFPVAFMIGSDQAEEAGKFIYLVYLFPLVGVFLMAAAGYQVARYLKYGRTIFEMSAVPGVIGGPLAGIIHTKRNIVPADGFRLRLSCIDRYTSGSGDSRSTHEDILWQDERVMEHEALESDPSRSAIPVLFAIPYGEKPTDAEDARGDLLWRLEVKAQTRGIDFSAQFEVPVFITGDSTEDFALDESAISQYVREPDMQSGLAKIGVQRVETVRGSIYTFPPARNLKVAVFLTGFTAVFTGILYAIIRYVGSILFSVVFGVVNLFLYWALLNLWLRTSRIETFKGGIRFASGYVFPGEPRELNRSEIEDISLHLSMTSGNQAYYSLQLLTTSGKKYTLGSNIKDKRLGEMMIATMQREIQG